MRRGFSCYLDLVRVTAAGLVFLHHLAFDFGCYASTTAECVRLTRLVPFHAGHSAVVLFFVLSGYVITYVASERETTLREFALARTARIYSVAVPTLLLIMCIDAFAYRNGDVSAFPLYQYQTVWKYLPLILAFCTDHWFLTENAFSLGAWWSVAYEVWYYVLFASVMYARGWWRWVAPLLVMLIMGPKLLAMFPLWLLGSLVYLLHRRAAAPSPAVARTMFAVTIVGLAAILLSSVTLNADLATDAWSGGWITRRLRFSQWFAGDFAIACVFALNVYAAGYLKLQFGRAERPIRFLAGYTFTFYMIHGPVEKLFAKYVDHRMITTAMATIGFTFVFGLITEQQKGRLRGWLARAFQVPGKLAAQR